ncbi:hypothetical protein [Acidithiobacillus caldus]|jgi:hypothetical protein|uniref:hypothetical protein n=1 Tax=Acidithiobacillus caldus TaxID=33059 RepID=UPI0007F32B9B|nr:hypothetical protein [Acidithiobacillus caldus]MBU2735160.1 hypothetical protein [Acidithiobacillus caldus ATCC 51756]MBU2802214.1 hypothetical protein [Acidithiobacillus caldus]QER45645.1 hypothetical protein F0726_02593 [Acidithiobacillus caldus]
MKRKTMYQIREYPSDVAYSKPLGFKLRSRQRADKLRIRLSNRGRDCFLVKFIVHC